jgi:hypothetical protein
MMENPLERCRVETLDMLNGTKVEINDCFKTVAECIENNIIEVKELHITCNTICSLDHEQGYDYFKGNIKERGRYQNIAVKS